MEPPDDGAQKARATGRMPGNLPGRRRALLHPRILHGSDPVIRVHVDARVAAHPARELQAIIVEVVMTT